jgi:hypothetical protein
MAISPYFQQPTTNTALMQLQANNQQKQPGFWENLGTGLRDFFVGKPAGLQKINNFEPNQIEAINQILSGGLQQFQNPYAGFQPLEDYARRQFSEQTIPSLAERFTYLTNARPSSESFKAELGGAGAGLEAMLNAQRSQYGQEQQGLGLKAAAVGLTPQFNYIQNPGTSGLLGSILPTLAQGGLSAATGGLTGAPAIAQLIGRLFRKG